MHRRGLSTASGKHADKLSMPVPRIGTYDDSAGRPMQKWASREIAIPR